jgi:hypothetical protein
MPGTWSSYPGGFGSVALGRGVVPELTYKHSSPNAAGFHGPEQKGAKENRGTQ